VAEWVSENGNVKARFIRFGTADEFLHVAGDQPYARKLYGLTADNIATRIVATLNGKRSGSRWP
jgi:transketolase C-terminal domain/subunit